MFDVDNVVVDNTTYDRSRRTDRRRRYGRRGGGRRCDDDDVGWVDVRRRRSLRCSFVGRRTSATYVDHVVRAYGVRAYAYGVGLALLLSATFGVVRCTTVRRVASRTMSRYGWSASGARTTSGKRTMRASYVRTGRRTSAHEAILLSEAYGVGVVVGCCCTMWASGVMSYYDVRRCRC